MGPPVAVVQLSGEGKFAFVEFRDELIAITALQLDKIELAGRPLNVGRPAGYMPAPGMPLPQPLPLPPGVGAAQSAAPPDPAAAAAVAALVGGAVGNPLGISNPLGLSGGGAGAAAAPNQANRKQRELYIGNLPVGMVSAQQLKELFRAPLMTMPNMDESSGPLVSNVDLSTDGKFAFVEFRDEPICTLALTLFDKMEVCGRALNVGRPRGYIDPAAPLATSMLGSMIGGAISAPSQAPSQAPPAPPAGGVPSSCIKLEGMLKPEDVAADDEYTEIHDDIKQECETYGSVSAFKLPRTGPLAGVCFVKFEQLSSASRAREALDKRQFDGNTVNAVFLTEAEIDEIA
uniref:RRM domain-containing protein n=1 Tax=Haptolina brevifila TaxID=156173 RepID=A0A7S2C055_9EUKA|mmetsp:Transcript_18592/g.37639  ORF Transcript_18592/g.37639 Transcript_18592/m.37639 type:complete len:346 (+) Transcript_18592:1195-2232(+)